MQRRIKNPPPLPQTSKMKISEKTVKDFLFLTVLFLTLSQKSGLVSDTCYKMIVR